MTSIVQHNCQKTEQLTEKTWGRGYVVLVMSTKWRFVEDVNTDNDFLYPFLNCCYSLLEFTDSRFNIVFVFKAYKVPS